MIYFDTNVLVYATIEQDTKKYEISNKKIKNAILKEKFCISSLVFSEYIFVLSKLKIINDCLDRIDIYKKYIKFDMPKDIVLNAYKQCNKLNKCRNINDFIHLEIANKYCDKLTTFDSDFKNLEQDYSIDIEIIKS